MTVIRWGILGCGRIARKFASDLQYVKDAELIAVASRHQATADAFAKEFPAKYRHDSYEALAENPEVDVIYIASPHSHHHEHTLMCLERKKAVLCEKALALNSKQVKEMIDKARKEKVFLMEALWTKFLPHYQKLQEIADRRHIGRHSKHAGQLWLYSPASCSRKDYLIPHWAEERCWTSGFTMYLLPFPFWEDRMKSRRP